MINFRCVLLAAVEAAISAVVGTAITIWRTHCRKLAQHGTIDLATTLISRNRHCPQRRPVIALVAAYDLRTLALTDFNLILPRKLECSLDCLRSSAAKINCASAKILPCKFQQIAGVLFSYGRGELASVDKLQAARLLGHRGHDFRDTVPDEV